MIDVNEGVETVNPNTLLILSKYKAGKDGHFIVLSKEEDFGIILDRGESGIKIIEFVPIQLWYEGYDIDSDPRTNRSQIPVEG